MSAIVPSDFSAENITFSEPKKVKSRDGKTTTTRAYMLYEDKLRYWETHWLRAPFGLRAYEAKEGEKSNYSLNISARAVDPSEQEAVDLWFNQWEQVDELLTDHAVRFSKIALGKQYSASQREVVQALQTRVVKAGDNDENGVPYPSRMGPKVPRDQDNQNRPAVAVYVDDSTVDLKVATFDELVNLLPKGSRVRLILQPKLWFISGKFGISLSIIQIQVQSTGSVKLSGFAFSKTAIPAISADAPVKTIEAKSESTQVADSEEEVADDLEE